MSAKAPKPPFERSEHLDEPGLVGAVWWQESMSTDQTVLRRRALTGLAIFAATMATFGAFGAVAKGCSEDVTVVPSAATEAQRAHGWSFGSETDPLLFDLPDAEMGATPGPSAFASLAQDFAPKDPALRPFYVPTLFQSLNDAPTSPGGVPLRDVLRRLDGPSLRAAYHRGTAMTTLFENAPHGTALVIDLPGAESVAFAAGLSHAFDPVFQLDNWPHPKAVVPSHLALGAALTYRDALLDGERTRPLGAPPAFILDRHRLDPYVDQSDRFDNRYVARLPPLQSLRALGIQNVLYVRPDETSVDLDDVNADLAAWQEGGINVRSVPADAFVLGSPSDEGSWEASVGGALADAGSPVLARHGGTTAGTTSTHMSSTYWFGGSPVHHHYFWQVYGFGSPARSYQRWTDADRMGAYRVQPRTTLFGGPGSMHTRPSLFGNVGVLRSSDTGELVGRSSSGFRSGSWGRSSGWSGS